jgi:signal transduction histidine kinase
VETGRIRLSRHPLGERLGFAGSDSPIAAERMARVHPDDVAEAEALLAAVIAGPDQQVKQATVRVRDVRDEWRWIDFRIRVFARDPAGRVRQVLGVATDVTETRGHAQALTDAAMALAQAEQNERRRIGRELHDSTAQLLVAARLGLGGLERSRLSAPGRRILEEVRTTLANAQTEIRNLTYVLHPPPPQGEGLDRMLRAFARGFAQRTGLKISVRATSRARSLPSEVEVALFRIAQEALMNVYRHANARHAWVRLQRQAGRLTLEVEDDGVGLSAGGREAPSGVGVSGMRARMVQLGGSLDLAPAAHGLVVRASLACRPAARKARSAVHEARGRDEGRDLGAVRRRAHGEAAAEALDARFHPEDADAGLQGL